MRKATKKRPNVEKSPERNSSSSMSLAEALLLRADLQTRMQRLEAAIVSSAVVQEGDKPSEDPLNLLKEHSGMSEQLEKLIVRINTTNLQAKLDDGTSLTQAVARRDTLKRRRALLLSAADASKRSPDRYGLKEIRWVHILDVTSLRKQIDGAAEQIRKLNIEIQKANWATLLSA